MTSTVPNLTAAGLLNYDANDRLTSDVNETYDASGNTASTGGVINTYEPGHQLSPAGAVSGGAEEVSDQELVVSSWWLAVVLFRD